jgi:hypothetical protein
MRTILVDRKSWDLVIDASGNIAVADDPYAKAQDAASAIKLFAGECFYDTSRGVPYWIKSAPSAPGQILGAAPPLSYIKQKLIDAAMTVPGVVSSAAFIRSIGVDRTVTGQVQITDEQGRTLPFDF